jgi:LuxR family maltose regulon positive regulatory protein
LLQTAILDRLTGSLCDALTGQNTGRATLEMLEHANLFLIPLDDEHRWYRYHHLFADFLGQRLREKETDSIPELHRRASQWFEVEGSMDDAIQHALAAKDMERAARLVDQIAASLIVRRNPNALLKWIGRLPPDLCQGYPMLCVWRAWALYFARQLDAVEPLLQTAEANRDKVPHLPIPGYATTVRAYLANERGDLPRAIALSQQALEEMADAPPGRDTLIHQGAAVIGLGINYRHLGDLDRARQLFVQATSLNLKAGNIYAALGTKAQLGHLAMSRGQLHHAVEHYRRGLQMVQEWADQEGKGRGAVLAASELHLSLGTVLYQWNDLAGAAPHLQRAVELCELGEDWWRLYSYRMLAYLKQAEGETEAAYDLMQRSCAIRDTLSVRQVMNYTTEPGLEQLRISLSRARPEMAHLLADVARRFETQGLLPDDDIDFCSAAGYLQESEYADLARALIALARAGEAVPLLERLLAAAQLVGRHGATIYYLTLLALAFHALGDTPAALAHLCQALTLAEPEGYVRIFVDEGPPMARLLYEALSREIAPDYVRRLLAAFPITEPEQTDVSKILATNSELIEPLSDRELEVLRLFAEGLTNREIASRLFLAVNTVKAHAGNIYGKLNVHSRTQAIARAQALGLFPPK